jgi:cytochrome P450
MEPRARAESPVMKLDFVNNAQNEGVDSTAPQPRNHELAARGATDDLGVVAVNSRALVDEALRDADIFSSEDLVEQGNTLPLIPLNIDPPAHRRFRKLLDPLFAPRRIDALEDQIAERVHHFIDGFVDRGSCDFTNEFAELFPSSVFLGMMGLPWEDLPTMTGMRDGILRPGTAAMSAAERSQIQRDTAQEVYRFFDAILDERSRVPRDDILSMFVQVEVEGERLTREEMLAICFVLLTAGLDTVTDSLTCFWAFLAQHPAHREALVGNPDLIPEAVEELLRWETPVPAVVRWAREEHAIGGKQVDAGHLLMVNLSAANLDPAEFADPLEVQFDRAVNRHVAFGGGIHRCLGSHLARRELRVALREWHRRIPEYELAPGYTVGYRPPLRFVPDLQLVWSR